MAREHQVMTWVSVGSQEEFSTIQSKFGHITHGAVARESPGLDPHHHFLSLWPFSSSITIHKQGPIWLLMSCCGKTWNNPCFVIIDSHHINSPCRTVLQREDINSQAWQGLQVWVFNCTLRRSWFRSWHCLQLSLNFTTHHHHHHVTLNPTVYPFYWQASSQYNLRSILLLSRLKSCYHMNVCLYITL